MTQSSPVVTADVRAFQSLIRSLAQNPHAALRGFLAADSPTVLARAPGRLDVMGGIADYSGSLVLQLPIAEATLVAVQRASDDWVRVVSVPAKGCGPPRTFAISCDRLGRLHDADYGDARRQFGLPCHHTPLPDLDPSLPIAAGRSALEPSTAWAGYIIGVVLLLARERHLALAGGLRILVHSQVPEGKGVSSSAALEVAAMQSLAHLLGARLPGPELARLCQLAENRVVGAPCGIMDQMTAALGRAGHLLALRCQPAVIEGLVAVPEPIRFWGIDSGIRHAVAGSDYTSVRTGAFMGYRILADLGGLETTGPDASGVVTVCDPRWHGYLANLDVAEWTERFSPHVPDRMRGDAFLARYGGTTDPMTRVDPARIYAVRQPTAHPINEHARVRRFAGLLSSPLNESTLREMGDLMLASHESYSVCGIGSDGTDLLVQLVRERCSASGLYGARITGGGSGGTVAVLGRETASAAVAAVAADYERETGRKTRLFAGSSPGACDFGVVQLNHGGSVRTAADSP